MVGLVTEILEQRRTSNTQRPDIWTLVAATRGLPPLLEEFHIFVPLLKICGAEQYLLDSVTLSNCVGQAALVYATTLLCLS